MLLSDRSPTSQEGVGLRGGWREGRVWKWKERKGRSCSKGLGRKGRRDRIYIFVTRDNLMEPQASGLMGPVGPGPMRRWAQTCCWTPAEEPSLISWAALIIMSEFTRQGIGNWEWASPRCLMRYPSDRPTWDPLTQLHYLLFPSLLCHHHRAKTIGKSKF